MNIPPTRTMINAGVIALRKCQDARATEKDTVTEIFTAMFTSPFSNEENTDETPTSL